MYRELYGGAREELPSILAASGYVVEPDRPRIVDYMGQADHGLDVMESVPDIFQPGAYIPGGSSLHTDGTWIWRTDSLRYVSRERLALPADFAEFARARAYTPLPVRLTGDLRAAIRAWW